MKLWTSIAAAACLFAPLGCNAQQPVDNVAQPAASTRDPRLDWWREARFGMFIHWGLYAVPAGEWGDRTDYGEWIRSSAKIPVAEYEKLLPKFNPVKFDAKAIVRAAKAAGMKYIVITSKHHDGFCLFDSKETDWDVMSTPFKRDIMKELADACRAEGLRICWYHSIMDWHHPDYTPRRDWETDRPTDNANFDRYVAYMKAQLKELLTNYGDIGVLWFDGQWEGTWTHERGVDLYNYVRSLQPRIIINNRVDKGGGAFGITRPGYVGDYGTPEQEIPPMGLPNVDWETCMTMNDHWGYNRADKNFKTSKDLIQKLADIASKGGNFLLNVGPTAEGEIPPESLERLADLGAWMKTNSESIYGTQAGPLGLPKWGRCTQKQITQGNNTVTRLYLHIFDWPKDGRLVLENIYNEDFKASLLAAPSVKVPAARDGDTITLTLPALPPDANDSVVILDLQGAPDVGFPPDIHSFADVFVKQADVVALSDRPNVVLRGTLDGTEPTATSSSLSGPFIIDHTATVKVRAFRGDRAVSPTASRTFTKVEPRPAITPPQLTRGLVAEYYEGDFDKLPDFATLTPKVVANPIGFNLQPRQREDKFAFRYTGYITIGTEGVYRFFTNSDDGSRMWIGDQLVVDNDGLHSSTEKSGIIALAKGFHPVTVGFFEKSGGHELQVSYEGPGIQKREIPWFAFCRERKTGDAEGPTRVK